MLNPLDKLLSWYFTRNALPYWCILLIDFVIVMFCGMLVYWTFTNTTVVLTHFYRLLYTVLFFALVSTIGFRLFHTYSGIMRYASFVDLMRVINSNALSLVIVLGIQYVFKILHTQYFMYFNTTWLVLVFILSTLLMWCLRIIVKTLYEVAFSSSRAQRVLIYGTMTGGVGLAKLVRSQRPRRYLVKGFITHDTKAKHTEVMGEPVFHIDDDMAAIIKRFHIDAVLVSPYRVNEFRNNQKVQDILIGAGAKILMVNSAREMSPEDELSEEEFKSFQLREVSVEELLPRSEIRVDLKSVAELLEGRRVLITGSAGSIGSELARQVASFKPSMMILIDQAETPQHDVQLMMANEFPDVPSMTIVTGIDRKTRMESIFAKYRPEYVFHAAAYKHVPMMENNPSEAVLNNVYGTKVIADISVRYGVKKFVMVSTDKAVNPTNVMGCSKRICEIYVQSLNKRLTLDLGTKGGEHTQFVTTRFGNVLGSNGSVIPLFREQIKKGGPVTVTDERIVRYFMLIPEACKLVLEAGTKGNGGEIFVFDMGKPVRIADLAKRMIALSGAKGIKIQYTGLREGEKLYEEVLNELEGSKPTFHEKIRIAAVREYDYDEVNRDIEELFAIAKQYDNMATVKKMKEIVPEYVSNNSVYEQLDASPDASENKTTPTTQTANYENPIT